MAGIHKPTTQSSLHVQRIIGLKTVLCWALFVTCINLRWPRDVLFGHWIGDNRPLVKVSGASCPVQAKPLNVGNDWNPESDKEYSKLAIDRLIGAVQIPTESFDNMNQDPYQEPRFDIFEKQHEYLEKTFSLVHSHLELTKLNRFGLLYTWKGSNSKLKPIVLMAHQDVVPVNPSTKDQWTYEPFSGHLDERGWIWARGVADCKNTLIGIMSAIEQLLLEDDFEPQRTIVLSFGFDEEIGGRRSARPLAEELEKRYGKDGVALILDEGFTGVDTAYGVQFARLGMAEKGAIDVNLEVLVPGGHSSVPRSHTGIGIMSLLLVELEKNPDVPRLQKGNPMLSYLNCAADHGEMDKGLKRRVRKPKEWRMLGKELASQDDTLKAFLSTTQAADLVQGGVKVNALPEYTAATVNYRIDFLQSVDYTKERIASILEPVVKSLNLTFDKWGSHPSVNQSVVRLIHKPNSQIEPAPLTPAQGPEFELMSGTIKHVFDGAIVAPSGMIANTDTKWTWNLTGNIYRFVPGSLDLIKNFHTVDERIQTKAHLTGIRFFYKLIRNTQGWVAE